MSLQELEVSLSLRQQYIDPRLASTNRSACDDEEMADRSVRLAGEAADAIWQPDTFFSTSREVRLHGGSGSGSGGMTPNVLAAIGVCDGSVYLSKWLTVTLACPGMRKQLQFEQNIECTMKIASCESVLARFIYRARLILNLSLFFV